MKITLALIVSLFLISCSSSDKKADIDTAKNQASESAKEAMADTEESAAEAVESVAPSKSSSGASCDMKLNRSTVNFGSPKVTSRAFRRLRLKSGSGHTVTNVSSFSKPFGYYNSGDFPGEATYHNYDLCSMSSSSKDCSVNLEFRPRAVNDYSDSMTISYTDGGGNDCSVDVPMKGVATESYLGKDSSKGLPDN